MSVQIEGSAPFDGGAMAAKVPGGGHSAGHSPLGGWGKNDPFFLPAGTEAFKRDLSDAQVRSIDTKHFALETHCDEIAEAMRNFLTR